MTIIDPSPPDVDDTLVAPDVSPATQPAPEAPPAVGEPKSPSRVAEGAKTLSWTLVGAGAFITMWALLATRAPDLPTPSETFATLRDLLSRPFYDNGPNDKGIGLQLLLSLQRVAVGFGLAALVGIPLGIVMGTSRRVWQAVNPIVQVLRPVSPLAWFPIGLAALSDAPHAAVLVIFITALWPTVVNTAAGAATVPRDQRNVAKVFHFGRFAYLRHVMFPHTLPSIVTGLRLSMGIAWMVIVAVEMLSGGTGIGFFIWDSYNTSNLPAVASAILVVGVVGLLLDNLFLRLARRVTLEEAHI